MQLNINKALFVKIKNHGLDRKWQQKTPTNPKAPPLKGPSPPTIATRQWSGKS
jgi:hypothetical protein